MTTEYFYGMKELGNRDVEGIAHPTSWSGLPEGEEIQLHPKPELPQSARKTGDDMTIYGPGGAVLDDNHDVDHSVHPIGGEARKVKMRCP